ncbi:hypothetical protein C0036_23185 [Streptomyces sp. DJ]|nr:hypothetical protein C0036_23185 [Streptomyces sp. DJ]
MKPSGGLKISGQGAQPRRSPQLVENDDMQHLADPLKEGVPLLLGKPRVEGAVLVSVLRRDADWVEWPISSHLWH